MDIDALLRKDHADLTREEWDELRSYVLGDNTPPRDPEDLEARLAQSVSDWSKFSQVISDILRS